MPYACKHSLESRRRQLSSCASDSCESVQCMAKRLEGVRPTLRHQSDDEPLRSHRSGRRIAGPRRAAVVSFGGRRGKSRGRADRRDGNRRPAECPAVLLTETGRVIEFFPAVRPTPGRAEETAVAVQGRQRKHRGTSGKTCHFAIRFDQPVAFRRGGRAAECTGLENRSLRKGTQGSNPCLSAFVSHLIC